MAAINALPIKKGLQASYDALVTKDAGIIYITTDTKRIYLGTILLSENWAAANPLTGVAFDPVTQVFTFTKADSTTETVDLVLESVLQGIDYDSDTKELTLTLVSGAETTISLADLIDIYTGGSTQTADVSIAAGVVKADVKVSAVGGNAIEKKADGLYVAPAAGVSVDDTDSISLAQDGNGKITADLNISGEPGNIATLETDGLYVPETDTKKELTNNEIVLGGGAGYDIKASGKKIVAEINDATPATDVPSVEAVIEILTIGDIPTV